MNFKGMFGDMGGAGAPGGAKGGGIDNKRYYELLGVPQNATDAQIKKAYRKLVIKHHPDKGGDVEKFKEIDRARVILSDP
jgi:DnaJ family protein A protein 2